MRKTTKLLVSLLLMGGLFTVSQAQDKALKNGFGLNFSMGIPTGDLAADWPKDFDDEQGWNAPMTFGVQIGNRWYIMPEKDYGFGIMINWLDFSLGKKEVEADDDYTYYSTLATVSLLEFGPIGTYALDDDMAIDAYYNIKPNAFYPGGLDEPKTGNDDDLLWGYLATTVSHSFGVAFRYDILSFGLEMNFGKMKGVYLDSYDGYDKSMKEKLPTSVLKINLGVKF